MGDADVPQITTTAQELDLNDVEDALSDVGDEMNRLFTFVTFLNDRTTNIMREVVSWQKFRSCFAAFNLFVVPIILIIVSTFVTVTMVELDSHAQDCFQAIVMCLVHVSGFVGLPLYIYTLWKAYFTADNMEEFSIRREQSVISLAPNVMDTSTAASRTATLADVRKSFHSTISDIRKLLEHRIELERRINEVEEAEQESTLEFKLANYGTEQMEEAWNYNVATAASRELIDLDFTRGILQPLTGAQNAPVLSKKVTSIPRATSPIMPSRRHLVPRSTSPILFSTGLREEETNIEEDICGVKITINADRNFSVEIEKEDETSENMEPVTDEIKSLDHDDVSAGRNISVENVGEGDSSVRQK